MKAVEDQKGLAYRLLEVFAEDSAVARVDLLDWPYTVPLMVEGYRHYFKKKEHDLAAQQSKEHF